MNKIKNIIKNTLLALKNKNINATPNNYYKEFSIQAELVNEDFKECQIFKEAIYKLTQEEQDEVQKNNIETYDELVLLLLERISIKDINNFVDIIDHILAPSVNYDIEHTIKRLSVELSKDPKKLFQSEIIRKIKKITENRISADRAVVRDKALDIAKLTSLMGKYFDKSLIKSNNTMDEISNIKSELESLNLSDSSYRELGVLKSKLINTVFELENSVEKSQIELIQGKSDFEDLHKKINKLQKELENVKEERNLDYLTGVMNRRAFDIEVKKIEHKFKFFKSNYAIVFYDIDHFKSINDTYGHDCGDSILKIFAEVLKYLTRQEDVVARYGGEEFVALINYNQEKEIIKYLKRMKKLIKTSNFVYEDYKLKVQFSAGLVFRNKYSTYQEAIKRADGLLYQAKHEGRDKIILDDGMEL